MVKQHYDHMLNFGNGDQSSAEAYYLIERLMKAFDLMGGLQQGPSENYEWEEIAITAEDIYTALTGQIIKETTSGTNSSLNIRSPFHEYYIRRVAEHGS